MIAGSCLVAFFLAAADPTALPVQVMGATTCPAPAEVEAALAGLVAARDAEPARDVAELRDDADAVVVTLRRGSGEPIGDKRLASGPSCAERARAAAVIIAAWEARLATQAGALVVPPPAPPAAVAQSQPPAMVAPAVPPPFVELGVEVGGAINGTTLARAGVVEIGPQRPNGLIIPTFGVLIVGPHTQSVGPGSATWRRYGVLATAASRRYWGLMWAEARTGVALTLLDISGSSFPTNGSGMTFDPGIHFGARFGLRTRASRVRCWLDGTIALWPRSQEVYVQGTPGSAILPRGEVLLSLGASYAFR